MTSRMSTIVLPTDDGGEVEDARRLKLFAAVGGVAFLILLVFIWALWPAGKKRPRPGSTPLASATNQAPGETPQSNDPLGFVAAAKPLAVVQRTPGPQEDKPESSPSAAPHQEPRAWAREDNVTVYSRHGLNQPVIATVKAGTRMLYVEDYQNWAHVRLVGKRDGWVERKNLLFSEPDFAEKATPEEGRQTLSDFYAEVGRKDYAAAYARLSDEWKAELPYTEFVNGFKKVRSLDMQLGETEVMSGVTIRQHVLIDADEESRARVFKGTYTLEYHPLEWKLTSGILQETGPSNSSVPGL